MSVIHGKLLDAGMDADDATGVIGITGHESQQIESFNQQTLQLGETQMDPAFKDEVEQALKEQDASNKETSAENVG